MLNFLLLNIFVLACAFLIVYKALRIKDAADSAIALFVVYFSQIVFMEIALGVAGELYLKNVVALSFILLISVYLLTKKNEFRFPALNFNQYLNVLLSNKLYLFIFSLGASFFLIKILVNLLNPPFGWDSLNYHYTFPVEWIKNHNLVNPIVASDDPFPTYYPINGSLFFLWLILPFKSAFLADLGQLPFFLAGILSVFSIARKFGLGRKEAVFASILFGVIPNFFKQLQIGYVDIMVGGLFLVSLNFLLRLKEKFTLGNLILFYLSLGLFIGIKTSCIFYAVFLIIPFVYILFSRKGTAFLKKASLFGLFIMITAFFGLFSYIRNMLLAGNPLYPLEFSFWGKEIFKGVIDKTTFIWANPEGGYRLDKLLFHEGLGLQSLIIILPGVFLWPLAALVKKDLRKYLYFACLPIFLYLIYRLAIPIPNSRYLYPMLGIGMVNGFLFLKTIKTPVKALSLVFILCMIASFPELAKRLELAAAMVFGVFLFLLFAGLSKYHRLKHLRLNWRLGFLLFILFLLVLNIFYIDYRANEYKRYIANSRYWPEATKAWLWLNQETSSGRNIAYLGRPLPFPLYGTDFKNNVDYISVNKIQPIHLHDLKSSRYQWSDAESMHKNFELPGNYRGNANYEVWLGNLVRYKIEFLFIYSFNYTKDIIFPIEDVWSRSHPDKFKLVFSNPMVRIYKLIK
jgi:hypothetical protein